jgi:hypothetical protein
MVCYRHPKEETTLRCSKCEKPICARCAVLTTVGYRCPACGREASATRSIPVPQLFLGAVVGMGGGFLVARFLPLLFPLFMLLLAPVAGSVVAEAARAVMGRRVSGVVGALTAAGFLFGAMWGSIAIGIGNLGAEQAQSAMKAIDLWRLLFGAIAGGVAWFRLV